MAAISIIDACQSK